ncbi:MAG: protein kinase domain-containing protein [Saccharofermentanales bacterium]|jgi:serine/threonine protein kinase/cellulose synthase/poly-beta-1,6-N-acetylglucosamine synthase-like glycosyltransferase
MRKKISRRKRKIPENLGNSLCGVWLYLVTLVIDAGIHVIFFFLYGRTFGSLLRYFLSFIFFIYPLQYIADTLWSLRPSVSDILAGKLQINRKYYMNTVRKEVAREDLLPVTISIPVYMEDNAVIFQTLRQSMVAMKRYHQYSGQESNIVISDDGLAPMCGGHCTKEIIDRLIRTFSDDSSSLTLQEIQAAERILFYRKNRIPFVVRPQEGRRGLFKKSSNLNYTLRFGNAVAEGHSPESLTRKGQPFAGGYTEGTIRTNEIILLLDKDSGLKEKIIEAIIPEFAADDKLAYVQCATKAENLFENYYSYATGHQINNLFHNVWPCKALQGFFVPLIGHNVFLRKSILEKSGFWSEDKVSEDFDKAICFYGMGYHGKYAQLKGLEFTEYASRTFTEETCKQRRYAYGLLEMIFDGTIVPGTTRNCDRFYMLIYFLSLLNQVMLLPTVLYECYLGNIYLLWAGFIFCSACFIILPRIRTIFMRRRLPKEYAEQTTHIVILALSFVGHSYSILAGTCRYLANKIKANHSPFPSTNVDQLEYRFSAGVKIMYEYIRKNKWFLVIAVLCFDRGIFIITRKGIPTATIFTYCYILFCVVFIPFLLTPQFFAGFKIKQVVNKRKATSAMEKFATDMPEIGNNQEKTVTAWDADMQILSPRIVEETGNSEFANNDLELFLNSYKKTLHESLPEASMPEELLANYSYESCLRKDPEGRKEIYLLRREDKTGVLLKITQDYPEEDALEEANLLAELDHPGIPKVFDSFEYSGKNFILREYFEGRSLYEIVKKGGCLGTKDIFGIVLKLVDILSYLHSRKPPVIHRDIKPQNIIVGKDGSIHLIDFGIARFHKYERIQDTSVILTLDYASPEQYGFEQTTPLSDIYSLGVVMLFMATGRTARTELESQIVNNRLRNLIEQCIAFNPKSRIQSVEEIKNYIMRDSNLQKSKRKRSLIVAALLLICTICLSALSYGMGFFRGKSRADSIGYDRGYGIGYTDGYDAVPVLQTKEMLPDLKRGNSLGNSAIAGGAYAVQSEDLIFFISNGNIYKMSEQGAETELLVEGKDAAALSFYNGWLYYSSAGNILQTNIYTLETDILCENLSGELCIINDRYYVKTDDGLYLLNTLTGNLTSLNNFSSLKSLNITENGLFYIDKNDHYLYRSDLDGSGITKILNRNCNSVCLFEDTLFCAINAEDDEEKEELILIYEDFEKAETLSEINAAMINVTANGIYYINAPDGTINLCSFDGRIRNRISKNQATDFNIVGDWIFYHNAADGNRLWCVRLDGANDHPVQIGG